MKTKVIFRKFKKHGEIIALFPEIPSDYDGIYCSSYMHVGQHGGADTRIVATTAPAKPHEYAALKHELESEPFKYDLAIMSRVPSNAYRTRVKALKNL